MSVEAEGTVAPEAGTTAPAAPTPTPTPTPAKADQAKAEPVTPDPAGTTEVPEYEPTGDPGLDYALSFLARAGIDDEHPAFQAAANGDFGLLKATLAEKGVPGWEQAVALGEKALENIRAKEAETIKAVQESVLQVAEGVGVDWEAAVAHAKETGEPEQIEKLNSLFADPFTAKVAALYITHAYANAPGVDVPAKRTAVKEDAAPAPAGAQGGTLTRAEFAHEAGKLYRKFGDNAQSTPEYRALAARLQR